MYINVSISYHLNIQKSIFYTMDWMLWLMGFLYRMAPKANLKDLLHGNKKPPRLMYILGVYKKCIIMLFRFIKLGF